MQYKTNAYETRGVFTILRDTDNDLTRTYTRDNRKEIDRDPAGFTGRTTDNTARTARQSVELRRTKIRNGGDIIIITIR